MNAAFRTFFLVALFAIVYAKNESCGRVEDCPDAGTTCINGLCQCWSDQGAQIADIWSCNSDNTCAMSFPGHVCRISRDCPRTQGRLGYCQPIGAIRAAPAPVVAAQATPVKAQAQAQAQAPVVQPIVIKADVASTAPSATISTAASVASTAAPAAATTTMKSVGGGYAGRRR